MNRTRAYNVQQLYHYLTVTLSDHYTKKIFYSNLKYFPENKRLACLGVVEECQKIFTVQNTENNDAFEVNLNLGICSCPLGSKGGPCKHQHFVAIGKQKSCPNIVPVTVEQKMKYHFVALGNSNVDSNWYASLTIHEKPLKISNEKQNHDEEEIEPQNDIYDLIKASPKRMGRTRKKTS